MTSGTARRLLATVLAAVGLAGTAVADDGGFQLAAIPAIAYGSDVGFALGVATFLYRPAGVEGRYDRLTMSGAYTTRGPRSLLVHWEQQRIRDSGWGLVAGLRLSDDNQEPYWGEGAGLDLGIEPGAGSPPDPYRFHDRRLFLSVALRPTVTATPLPYVRVRWLGVDVVDAGVLLTANRPLGYRGGGTLLTEAGLVVDTRDRDVDTERGWYAYVSAFGAPALGSFSVGAFGGVDLAASLFVTLTPWAVLATRVLYDGKFGDVPFFERTAYEGLSNGGGLGGAGTIRGIARQRISGDQKALATAEIRTTFLQTRLWSRFVQLGASGGIDAGAARQRGYSAVGAVGAFAGLRAVLDRAVVVRLEVGYAGQGAAALYLVTGEQF